VTRNADDRWLVGVFGCIARALGTFSGLLRGHFLVFFFGVGKITFGISSGAILVFSVNFLNYIMEKLTHFFFLKSILLAWLGN
jgi:phage shock protein PspC (stress-responsive transcriptional regulator)